MRWFNAFGGFVCVSRRDSKGGVCTCGGGRGVDRIWVRGCARNNVCE
jgi:hypothetical protein